MKNAMKKFMEQLKPVMVPCVGNGSGTEFNDVQDELANPETEAITGIIVRAGDIVDAVGVIYGDGGKAVLHGNPRGGGENKVIFDDGDSLKSIEGVCDVPYAGNLNFSRIIVKTVKGREYGPFGGKTNGTPFKMEIPDGKMFLGFYGKVNQNACVVGVNSLGIIHSEGTPDLGAVLGGVVGKPEDNPLNGMFGGMK